MEKKIERRGGRREGAGRKPKGITTHPMALKLDNDLFNALDKIAVAKNRYINDAVRAKMEAEGLIKPKKTD